MHSLGGGIRDEGKSGAGRLTWVSNKAGGAMGKPGVLLLESVSSTSGRFASFSFLTKEEGWRGKSAQASLPAHPSSGDGAGVLRCEGLMLLCTRAFWFTGRLCMSIPPARKPRFDAFV